LAKNKVYTLLRIVGRNLSNKSKIRLCGFSNVNSAKCHLLKASVSRPVDVSVLDSVWELRVLFSVSFLMERRTPRSRSWNWGFRSWCRSWTLRPSLQGSRH